MNSPALAQSAAPATAADPAVPAAPPPAPAAPAAAPAAASESSIGDIVVTARKQEEKLQRVPVTVTALGTAALKQQTVQTTNDVQFHVPGLIQSPEPQGGQPDFAIRGTRQQGAIGSQGGVAVYIDYIPLQSTNSIAYSTYDMQSIQVLKGPQGTLFGKNTTGGAIIFAPNKPTHKFEGFVTGGYGNYNRRELTAMLNIPLGDTLALRVSGSYVHRDGYTKNIADTGPDSLDDENHESGRAILRWTPSDAFTNDVMFDYTHLRDHPVKDLTTAIAPSCTAFYSNCQAAFDEQAALGKRKMDFPNPQFETSRNYGVADVATYDLGGPTLRNIFSYRRDKYDDQVDNDGLALVPILAGFDHTKSRAITDELDLYGKVFDDRLDYTLGLYYSNVRFQQNYVVPILTLNEFGGLPSYFGVGPSIANNVFKTRQLAAFGQLTFHVDDKFSVVAGMRYTNERQRVIAQQLVGTTSPTDDTPVCQTSQFFAGNPGLDAANCQVRVKNSFSPLTWNFSLNYQASPTVLIYASAGRGFQAGGLNTQIPGEVNGESTVRYQSFRPETVHSFETGLKSDWHIAGRPGRTNVAVFYSKYQDAQRVINDNLANGQSFIATFNAANSTIYGAELELNYLPTPNLELSAFYSFVHAKYDQFIAPAIGINGGKDLSGSSITSTPKHTLGGTIAYDFHVGDEGKVRASLTGYYRSSTYANDLIQTNLSNLPGYALLNARIDVIKLAPVDIGLWMNNVTNKTYKLFAFDNLTSLGYAAAQYGAPRTFGAEATFKF